MKCESCGNELMGGAIICRVCNHNNALRGDWRSQRSNQQHGQQAASRRPGETQPNRSRTTSPLTELPRIVPRKDADANLIHFPPSSNQQEGRQMEAARTAHKPQSVTAGETGAAAQPAWRAELKERVRQIREKRNTGDLVAPPSPPEELNEVDLDRNPIVESALNRIRWSAHTPSITSTVSASTQGARAAAAAKLTQPETAPMPAPLPRPQPRLEPRAEARVEPGVATPRPTPAAQPALNPKVDRREVGRTGNQASPPAINRIGDQSKPRTASQPVNQAANQGANPGSGQANAPFVSHPLANQIETKTLTPKIHRETDARPEPKPITAPTSKILTPRAKPQAAAEPKTETRYERRGIETPAPPDAGRPATSQAFHSKPITNKPLSGAPDKHVATQVIEIAQAPEPMPLPEAEPASLWVRTLAGACDSEIIATTYLPIFGAYAVLNTSLGSESGFIMLLLLSAIVFIYQMVMLTFAGRTFGMALLNMNLVNTDDESMPVTRRQILLRAVAATVTFICFPLHLFTRFNLSQRSLPDWLSGTTVTEQ